MCRFSLQIVGSQQVVLGGVSARFPVVHHNFLRPGGFGDGAAGEEAHHDGLEIDDGRAVDRVETKDFEGCPLYGHDTADRGADAVRSALAALGEDADLRPVRSPPRVTCGGVDFCFIDLVEHIEHFDVRKALEACQRIRPEARCIKPDRRGERIPVVVLGFRACALDVSNGRDREGGCHRACLLAAVS